MKPVTSLLDPIPTSLFQSCFASLCPVVLSIINDSLCTGVVPPSFKIAAVTPVPKKTNIGYENLSNSFQKGSEVARDLLKTSRRSRYSAGTPVRSAASTCNTGETDTGEEATPRQQA